MLQNAPHGELFLDKLSNGRQSREAVLSLPGTRLFPAVCLSYGWFLHSIFIAFQQQKCRCQSSPWPLCFSTGLHTPVTELLGFT